MTKIKIGQLGIAHNHGQGKMQAVRHLPVYFEPVCVCEPDDAWWEKRGGLPEYAGLERVSEAELFQRCDAVLVETEVPYLTAAGARCVAAGKHIHLDKPAGTDYAAYETMLQEAERKGLVVQLGYMYRYNPAICRCRDMAADGTLGVLTSLNAEMSTYHSDEYRAWLTQFCGGSMYIFGSHLIDLAVLLLGEPKGVHTYIRKTGKNGIFAEDNCFAVLEYEKAIAKITCNSTELNGWGRRQLVVCGTRGTVEIKPLEVPTVMTFSDGGIAADAYADCKRTLAVPSVPNDRRYDEMMRDFYAYIVGEKSNPYPAEHELAVQRTLLSACGLPVR